MPSDGPPRMLEFFAYETIGAAVGHEAGLARIDLGEEFEPFAVSPIIAVLGDLRHFRNLLRVEEPSCDATP